MAGKKKKRGKGKRVDEFQLRKNLRDQVGHKDSDEEIEKPEEEQDLSQFADMIRIGGVEGGGTLSSLVIIDEKGTPLTEVKGPDTNHWSIGMAEAVTRINTMVQRGKEILEIPDEVPLAALGLCLSGCEEESSNRLLLETIQEMYPNLAKEYILTSDTLGSLRTGLENGGIVLIAGTGSNALMVGRNGTTIRCGGWGHMMGDEGSAYNIAHRACKIVFDDLDGLAQAPEAIAYVWPAMRNYYNVIDRTEMLPHIYTNFDKTKFAGFTKEIATGCEKGDPLCLYLLRENGKMLAKHVVALARKAHNEIKLTSGGLNVVCVGSVWKSWKFMMDDFAEEIHESKAVDELSLLQLNVSAAVGACYLAAEKIDCIFDKPYDKNVEAFYHYKRENYVKPPTPIVTKAKFVLCGNQKAEGD
ncbi:N-acetylglucosamine kinase isoform X2 [Andrena cerasifolii]|uniref:N-acetylglucosamine kinase isoform X2 n=1 Tax=Andrena cerasifolii TaxID=2819439 RepID=UPI004037764C